ncbi:MAG: hypothetical protein QG672_2365 [Pseudomonadota bacterium]|nr:hypothetical protein [Pseudomonadota bacterium]
MSLLLDALKKAEEAKRLSAAKGNGTTEATTPAPNNAAAELSLEPVGTPASSPLPDLSFHLDSLNADLAAVSTAPPLRGAPPAEQKRQPLAPATESTAEREAARNVFAAKRTPKPNRSLLWIGLAAASLAAAGIGAWFWWQLQSVGSNSLATRPALPAAPQPQATAPVVVPPPAIAPIVPLQAPVAAEPQSLPEPRTEKYAPAAPPSPPPENPVRITRGELRVTPALAKAYDQLQADDLVGAAKSYEQVLRSDSRNTDALLGMAAISLRQGQPGIAEGWYIKALEADPKDVNAQAGLINLRGQTDPAQAESRLKGLLATQPESATLNFALGNLYAAQRRWPEAQLAYFNAHTADPANPDYLFNLAASLDHMHMPKLALEYYQAALSAGAKNRTGFEAAQVKARILELQR